MVVASVGGSLNVVDADGTRRPARMADNEALVKLGQVAAEIHCLQSGLVEPSDVPVESRHLVMDAEILRLSDKPYLA